MKEMIIRVDNTAQTILEEEIKKKRNLGVATSVGDRFLIRMLEALENGSPAFYFEVKNNKLVARGTTA